MLELDVSELDRLAAELTRVPGETLPKLRAAVQTSSQELRDAYKADAQSIGHAPHFAGSITFETKFGPGTIEGEVGPDKGRTQGALGNILYFGTSKNGAVLDINGPLDGAEPKFEKTVNDTVKDILS